MEDKRAEHFLFELVSPEKIVFSEEIVSVVLPSASGYLTVMANHAPLVVSLIPGSVRVVSSSREWLFAVGGGVVEITPSRCSLLAEAVLSVDHLSFEELEQHIMNVRATLENTLGDRIGHTAEDFLHQLTRVCGVSASA
ncbi:ATP synthase F1, epsilon subunit [Bartonella bacilliformis str. Heidi Mejia]|uniref:ATP synthase epsilon chain n=2 Tax=Bartonella bacilliformis TaxID=774 RepID=A1UR50_BARBK|nr:ATP synthase F1 subunit epsilon [Bartonella bacilliformis]ABM44459.1 ATP synthase F1, epsilon subunit [Bartonella bacilliformis KC583]AMG85344.1 ATP synthase F1 subunit epsilon [Bartonella bacilliformis]EKS46009.1 ATP synthase F1, epsilon subunit [Bartonella bacilliformis INS]EYS88753.1 ATP synthase F1, epsilon subunit [Bartonella bacilliformis San Pedro600-02]EYS90715.1 ATP synthase F1, epsilon subunit [Bartonella bacilliformis str. Heidi Mejia]